MYNSRRWGRTKSAVHERDGDTCQACGRPVEGRARICDHRTPLLTLLAQGRDPYDPDECQTLCLACSGTKDGGRSARSPRPNPFLATVLAEGADQ